MVFASYQVKARTNQKGLNELAHAQHLSQDAFKWELELTNVRIEGMDYASLLNSKNVDVLNTLKSKQTLAVQNQAKKPDASMLFIKNEFVLRQEKTNKPNTQKKSSIESITSNDAWTWYKSKVIKPGEILNTLTTIFSTDELKELEVLINLSKSNMMTLDLPVDKPYRYLILQDGSPSVFEPSPSKKTYMYEIFLAIKDLINRSKDGSTFNFGCTSTLGEEFFLYKIFQEKNDFKLIISDFITKWNSNLGQINNLKQSFKDLIVFDHSYNDEGVRFLLQNVYQLEEKPDIIVFISDGNYTQAIQSEKQVIQKSAYNIYFKPIGNFNKSYFDMVKRLGKVVLDSYGGSVNKNAINVPSYGHN